MLKWIKVWALNSLKEKAKEMATVDNLTTCTCAMLNNILEQVAKGEMDSRKAVKYLNSAEDVVKISKAIATALEDNKIEPAEVKQIMGDIVRLFDGSPITDATIGDYIDVIAEQLKERI